MGSIKNIKDYCIILIHLSSWSKYEQAAFQVESSVFPDPQPVDSFSLRLGGRFAVILK